MISCKLMISGISIVFAVASSQVSAAEPQTHTMRKQLHVVEHQVIDHEYPMKGCMMSGSGLSAREYRTEMKDTSRPLSMAAIEAWNRKNNKNYGGGCAMPTG